MNNPLAKLFGLDKGHEILKEPGDSLIARITDSGRKVMKLHTKETKYSATQYSNGTIVETKTTKKK